MRCRAVVGDEWWTMNEPEVRKGMPPVKLSRDEFERRYRRRFVDPAFRPPRRELDAIIGAAWDAANAFRLVDRHG